MTPVDVQQRSSTERTYGRTIAGMKTTRYEGQTTGWVVQIRHQLRRDRYEERLTYWYGPDHGYGRTSGSLDHFVAVFDSEADALTAIAAVHGARPAHYTPVALGTLGID